MSAQYDAYLIVHKNSVRDAFEWMKEHIPQVLEDLDKTLDWDIGYYHDQSKYDDVEYRAYDEYFYGQRGSAAVKYFEYAWLHHIHNNPHHWQYWVLMNDDEKDGTKALEMPPEYVIEMICDWWSFSFRSGDLREIFKWYDEHKTRIIFHEKTRKRVERVLGEIDKALKEIEGEVEKAAEKTIEDDKVNTQIVEGGDNGE